MALYLFSCTPKEKKATASFVKGNAKHFSIEKQEEYTILSINNPYVGNAMKESYVLYHRDNDQPQLENIRHYIPVPVEKAAISSTTHLGFIEAMGALSKINAASGLNLYYSEAFQQNVEQGLIQSIGETGINQEQLIKQGAEILFAFAINIADLKNLERFRELGQKVIIIPEYMEQNPLAKAEWIKAISLFFEEEHQEKAELLYEQVKSNYTRIKEEARGYAESPSIMIGYPWRGNWYVSGGNSYQAQLIADANARYTWKDRAQTGGVPLSIEQVLNDALEADIWINCGSKQSFQAITEDNPLLSGFKAFKTGAIHQNYKRSNEHGANDYWEMGVVRPDLLLQDLVTIFHKADYSQEELYFYQKLAP